MAGRKKDLKIVMFGFVLDFVRVQGLLLLKLCLEEKMMMRGVRLQLAEVAQLSAFLNGT